MFNLNGYNMLSCSRLDKTGGGVVLYIKDSLQYKQIDLMTGCTENCLETVGCGITLTNKKKIIVGCIYRAPNSELKLFESYMEKIANQIRNKSVYLCGDFNFDLLKHNVHANTSLFIDQLYSYGLYPVIKRPTRITSHSATLIDNIFTSELKAQIESGILIDDLSDHLPIFQITKYENLISDTGNKKVFKRRVVNDETIATFNANLCNFDWSPILSNSDVNTCYDLFVKNFNYIFNKTCPMITTTVNTKHKSKPWMSSSLINCCRKKNLLYKRFLQTRTDEASKRYKKYKNKLTTTLRSCEKQYYSDILAESKNDAKKTWKIINEIINKKKKASKLPTEFICNNKPITGNLNIAKGFNEFFVNVGPNLAGQIRKPDEGINFSQYMNKTAENSIFLDPVTDDEILNTVKICQNKSSKDVNDISMCDVKNVISQITKPLAHIFNLSFVSGKFPDNMKTAKIIPIYKAGDRQNFTNYRPVSLLPQFSKILEKLFNKRIMTFIQENDILFGGQYGFQNKLSTALAILELTEEITTAIDSSKYTLGVFIDLKKAFDTINHSILLKKLERYGIRGIANDWIASYLVNRFQFTSIENIESEKQLITCGVPQGSVLGPSLFLLYVNDMPNASKVLKAILFADDTNLFYSGNNIKNMCDVVSKELMHLNQWFIVNKLSLNVSKTNFMIFSNRNVAGDYRIKIDGSNIERVFVTKFLGVHIDAKLSWKNHIDSIKTKISKNVSIMYRVKYLLDSKALYALYCSLILPYLNYCCEIWGNNFHTRLEPLIKLQKRAMRIVEHCGYREHTKPIFHNYRTLRLDDLVKLTTMSLMYKVHNGDLPIHILQYFKIVNTTHCHRTRQRNDLKIQWCRTRQKSFSLSVLGPKIWNNLPINIKQANNYRTFKWLYKNNLLCTYVEL
jgi:hypothetical protein